MSYNIEPFGQYIVQICNENTEKQVLEFYIGIKKLSSPFSIDNFNRLFLFLLLRNELHLGGKG